MYRIEDRNYILAGLPFIIIGLIVNPWLFSWLLNVEFTTTIFSGILFFSIAMIVIGWGIIYKKKTFGDWLFSKYRDIAMILLNVIVAFALLNFIAAIILFTPEKLPAKGTYYYMPADLLQDSVEYMRQIYPGKSDEEIKNLVMFRNPYINHPVLEFQERIQTSNEYNVGFEGIRYDAKVTRKNAPLVINGAIWVFGGSTVYGQGVNDNETITAYLNQIDTSNTYINFGVHAYHQSNEIEKMLLLLKKGYRPGKVIFIDGLNDIVRMIETNFHPLETPALAKSAYGSDYNIATKETGNTIVKQLPLTKLIVAHLGKNKPKDDIELSWTQYDDVYDENGLYHKDAKQHFNATILRSPYIQIDTAGLNYIAWKLQVFYKSNYAFIDSISKAFNFEFSVYYQPLGVLSKNNPFWKDKTSSRQTPLFSNFNYVIPKVQDSLQKWNFARFYDISQLNDSCPACYVDLTHYNPNFNELIAKQILNKERESKKSKKELPPVKEAAHPKKHY